MALQPIKAKQVSSLGESPAEARRRMEAAEEAAFAAPKRMQTAGASLGSPQGRGQEVPELTAEHIAAIRKVDEGFSGGRDGSVEVAEELAEPPTPSKAMEMIQQLSQDKLQLSTELNAALFLVERYKAKFGELD